MSDQEAKAAAAEQGETLPRSEACDVEIVTRRAKAGLVTICVAVTVAVLVLAGAAATLMVTGIVPLSGFEGRITAAIAPTSRTG